MNPRDDKRESLPAEATHEMLMAAKKLRSFYSLDDYAAIWRVMVKAFTPSHVAPNPLLSHECGKNMVCRICGSLPIVSAASTTPQIDPTKLRGEERQKYIHDHDCPKVWEFFHRWSGGSKLCPSCLLCGHQQFDPALWSIRHAELPDIYICKGCVDNARSAASATPCSTDQLQAALFRVIEEYGIRYSKDQPASDPEQPYYISMKAPGHGQSTCHGATPGQAAQRALDWLNRADGGKQT